MNTYSGNQQKVFTSYQNRCSRKTRIGVHGRPEYATISIFALLCLITFFCFIFSSKIMAMIGKGGLDIVTRLMGLILTVIGVQMLIVGVLETLSHLT
ncbi:hypothetical protein J7439_25405 [Salinisphaera sp. G21_0]|nr:hypothetical protein [Salinisphaera sp. G21_0]